MESSEFIRSLKFLELNQVDAAKQLGVNVRTIRRWIKGDIAIPVLVEELLSAWITFKKIRYPWKSDSLLLVEDDALEVKPRIGRNGLDIELIKLLSRVEDRNGPATIWKVDLENKIATYQDIEVFFYLLKDGGFSPSFYRRKDDMKPDDIRDAQLLDDAYYCIAKKLCPTKNS